jgi:hypothetical protein
MMGGSTPNIDRIAREGALFTDYYAQQSAPRGAPLNIVGGFLLTFKEYPPSQVGGSLSIEKALQMVQNGASGGGK